MRERGGEGSLLVVRARLLKLECKEKASDKKYYLWEGFIHNASFAASIDSILNAQPSAPQSQ